ncbi:MAG: winged helix-turn-helix transcriptional regulator [Methanomicrobiales archaeon]|nr:winged helix-turn-helix transcriptional regulator [Methanomicrobiales archaeon]
MKRKIVLIVLLLAALYSASYLLDISSDRRLAPEGYPPSEIDTTIPISFFDLPLRVMLLDIFLPISPILLLPIEIIASIILWISLGCKRVHKKDILSNEKRKKIYECIVAQPGIHSSAIPRETELNSGTTLYHLTLLQLVGKIIAVKDRGFVRFYRNTWSITQEEIKITNHLRHFKEKEIIEILNRHPGATRKDISTELHISAPSISWYMTRLRKDEIVRTEKDGKFTRYYLNINVKSCIESKESDFQERLEAESPC